MTVGAYRDTPINRNDRLRINKIEAKQQNMSNGDGNQICRFFSNPEGVEYLSDRRGPALMCRGEVKNEN